MSTQAQQTVSIHPLIKWLQKLEKDNDRGTLAELRRGNALEKEQLYLLYRVVPPQFLDTPGDPPERIFMLASLFALHPLPFRDGYPPVPRRNVGDSLRELAKRQQMMRVQLAPEVSVEEPNTGPERIEGQDDIVIPDALKRRMDAVLAARSEDLFEYLRHIVRLLKTGEIPIDWDQLLKDLRRWDHPSRFVQRNWSRSFYVGRSKQQKGGE